MEKIRLGDICNPKQWKTLTGKELIENGDYPVYGANGVIGKYSSYNHEKETLLIGCRGTCGALNISVPYSYINGNAMALDNLRDDIDIRYLYYALKGRGLKDVISGAVQPQIIRSDLEKIEVLIGNGEEQNEIVGILSKVESIIFDRKQELKLLDELVKARFVEMFGDPVSNSMNLPELTLPKLGEFGRGVSKHRPRNDPALLGGAYPLIQTGEVAGANLYITSYENTYSELGLKQSKMWDKGTLCITIAANIAKTAILGFAACFPDSVVGFNANNKTNNIFIHYWFSFFQAILEAQAPESAQKNINLKTLSELKVMVPSKQKQDEFVLFVEQLDKSKVVVQKALDEAQLLLDSLMQKYFG